MTTTSVEELADANLIESIREHARWQGPVELIEQDGLLLFAGRTGYPGAYRNAAARADRGLSAEHVLTRARAFFAERERGFTLWALGERDQDLDALAMKSGMQRTADSPCMLIEAPVPVPEPAPEIRVERFSSADHVRDAIMVNAQAYPLLGLSADETRAGFPEPERLLSKSIAGFVAYDAVGPVATALTVLSGESAGVYWVGTVPRAHRTGLGGLCTRLATNAGFEHGARVVMLQASPLGAPLYARLGYRTYAQARWYRAKAESLR
jgi:hypothetical protein